jgi:tetratricopeptide (TPR) repeat protein
MTAAARGGTSRGSRLSVVASLLVPLLALVVVAAAGGRVARAAEEPEAQARRHFARGKQLYDERKYREAAEEFEAGYAVAPKPGFLLNIGHSYRRAGELRKAKRYYEMFLDKDRASPQRDEVRVYVKTIDDALADQQGGPAAVGEPTAKPPAAAVVPAASVAPAAAPPPSAPAPADGSPRVLVEVCRDKEPAPAAAGASPRWPWLVSGAAVVVAGAIAGVVVLMSRSGKNDPCGSLGCLNER